MDQEVRQAQNIINSLNNEILLNTITYIYVSAMKPKQLMLFRETVAVYCENTGKNSRALVRQRSTPTERSPLVGEVSAYFHK
jgi:hypothetical protein